MTTDNYVLITGASSGMGAQCAKRLSSKHNLVLLARDHERLNQVAIECKKNGKSILTLQFDLKNVQELASTIKQFILEHEIRISSFLHFAGMTEVLPISKTKYSVGLDVMNVNYFSATEIICTLLKKRINLDSLNSIVLVSSIIPEGGKKYQPHYCASKGALESLAKALACELAPKVRCNVISPGSFKTRIINTVFQSDATQSEQWNPPTLLEPKGVDEIAKVAEFLISENSSYITGQVIYVDGGERFPKF